MIRLVPILGVLGLLWFRLIDHLRVEWSLNPQYSYGWAVPFLCLFLLWRRVQTQTNQSAPATERSGRGIPSFPALVACAALYLPTRLVQEANPEWRLISWLLAFIVISLTWLLCRRCFPARVLPFPLLYFLVAVPWPTILEGPLIQYLTRANASLTVELLASLGLPAIQHGSVIEVATGNVAIDEACSGIRSFQATLMLSLFFGEVYRLPRVSRLVCVLAGFILAFFFNFLRTTLLTGIAALYGLTAIARWHDPAGTIILLACFIALWGLTLAASRSSRYPPLSSALRDATNTGLALPIRPVRLRASFGAALLAWFLVAEMATEAWYRSHEKEISPLLDWVACFPTRSASYRDVPLSEKTRRLLRYSEAINGAWIEPDGKQIHATFLRWAPGATAVHLAQSHTPDVCLAAAGKEILSMSDCVASISGVRLPFMRYEVRDGETVFHVFHCLSEDRAALPQAPYTGQLSYQNRIAPVLAGRRHGGQRSLELALWGASDLAEATGSFESVLSRILRVANAPVAERQRLDILN